MVKKPDFRDYSCDKRNCDRKSKNLPLKIKYCVIHVDDPKYNATVEGCIIDYILNNPDDPFFSECWNKRED